MNELLEKLHRIEQKLDALIGERAVQEYYSTNQVAEILGKADWTVREWCRLGRVNAEKRLSGRGTSKEWMISHEELLRIQSEGLLPQRRFLPRAS